MSTSHAELRELAERQHGVVARRQLVALGLSQGAITGRVQSGQLTPVGRGVFAIGCRPVGENSRWMTAVLERGPRVWIGDRSAAALWDLGVSDRGRTSLVCPPDGVRVAGLVRRTIHPLDGEIGVVRGIPVTGVARTLVDLSCRCRPAELRRAVERADELELFDLREVAPMLGRRGARPLRVLVGDAARHGLPQTRSTLEAEFVEFCIAQRLPRPQVNRWDGKREVDFRWPDRRVVVETDGWAFHRSRDSFERDAKRSQALAAQGWTLVRLTWRQLINEPHGVAARLRPVLGVK